MRRVTTFNASLFNTVSMYPPHGVSHRGGGLPLQHVTQLKGHPPPFYVPGKKYRVPMFLATSFNTHVAENFCVMAENRGESPVIWTIKVDARGASQLLYRCKHVNQASSSLVLEHLTDLLAHSAPLLSSPLLVRHLIVFVDQVSKTNVPGEFEFLCAPFTQMPSMSLRAYHLTTIMPRAGTPPTP